MRSFDLRFRSEAAILVALSDTDGAHASFLAGTISGPPAGASRRAGVRDPGLLVHHRQPPVAVAIAGKVVEPRYRIVVDIEGEALSGWPPSAADRGLDGAAMADRHHVPATFSAVMHSIAPGRSCRGP